MQQNKIQPSRTRRAVNDLVIAEMFLIQATLESAVAIGNSVSALGRQISQESAEEGEPEESTQEVLQRLRNEALEPYTSRYQCFREMLSRDH